MNHQVGIWIDHREAFIVYAPEHATDANALQKVASELEKHVRYSGHSATGEGSADDQRDRQYAAHLQRYYDDVIAHIPDAQSILIFGPGEAKGEFEKRLTSKGLGARIVGVETVDKMTQHQIAAKVRDHFKQAGRHVRV